MAVDPIRPRQIVTKKSGRKGGGGLGSALGAVVGGTIGTLAAPGPGTAAGALSGAAAGASLGGLVGGMADPGKAGSITQTTVAQAPTVQVAMRSQQLANAIKSLEVMPVQIQQEYTQPLMEAYFQSMAELKRRG